MILMVLIVSFFPSSLQGRQLDSGTRYNLSEAVSNYFSCQELTVCVGLKKKKEYQVCFITIRVIAK